MTVRITLNDKGTPVGKLADRNTKRSALVRLIGPALLAVALLSCGTQGSPVAPSPPNTGTLLLNCPTPLILGQSTVCVALMRAASGQLGDVSFVATWQSSSPSVVEVDHQGRLTAKSGGTVNISAVFETASATADVVVKNEDALLAVSAIVQWDGSVGSRVKLGLDGYYSVASADRGILSVEIRNDTGTRIATAAREVARGGGYYSLNNDFAMPSNTALLCAVAVLSVGGSRFEAPQNPPQNFNCLRVR